MIRGLWTRERDDYMTITLPSPMASGFARVKATSGARPYEPMLDRSVLQGKKMILLRSSASRRVIKTLIRLHRKGLGEWMGKEFLPPRNSTLLTLPVARIRTECLQIILNSFITFNIIHIFKNYLNLSTTLLSFFTNIKKLSKSLYTIYYNLFLYYSPTSYPHLISNYPYNNNSIKTHHPHPTSTSHKFSHPYHLQPAPISLTYNLAITPYHPTPYAMSTSSPRPKPPPPPPPPTPRPTPTSPRPPPSAPILRPAPDSFRPVTPPPVRVPLHFTHVRNPPWFPPKLPLTHFHLLHMYKYNLDLQSHYSP